MLKNICCSICLSINKRTINIYNTYLRNVYENLAKIKISDDECWMCYICHTRLRQCHQLQQLAVQTRGLIDELLKNKTDIKFGSYGCLLQLSYSKAKITNRTYNSSNIKQESEMQVEFCDNVSTHDGTSESTNHYEVEVEGLPLSIESEDPLVVTTQSTNMVYDELQSSKVLEVQIVKRSRSTDKEYVIPVTDLESRERRREGENKWEEQNTGDAIIKLEIEEFGDKSTLQDDERDTSCDGLNRANADSGHKRPFNCDMCFKTFKFKSDFLRHVNVHTSEKPHSCDICSRRFKSRECLNRHTRIHISQLPFSCEVCSKKYLFESDLQRHIQMHKGESSLANLENDTSIENNGDQSNICNVCSKMFRNRGSLNRHMRIHTGDKPYVCHICAKKFIEKSALDIHLQIHTGVKPYSCDVCDKKFSLKINLSRHTLIHTGKKPYSCDNCLKEFRYKRTYKTHKRKHMCIARKPETKKPFACDICSEKFSNERYLNAHTRIHTSDRVFTCELCPKKFLQRKYLNRHKQTHTGDKPYSCDICSQKFTQKGSLKVHKRSHSGERKFTCHICSKKFLRNSTLQTHIKIHENRNITAT